MAFPEEIFFLDDDDGDVVAGGFDDGGGFDAFEEKPDEDLQDKDEQDKEQDGETGEQKKPDEVEGDEDPEKKPEVAVVDPAVAQLNSRFAELERKNALLETELRKKNQPANVIPPEPEEPVISPQEWEENPKEANRKMWEYHKAVDNRNQLINHHRAVAVQQDQRARLKVDQDVSWQASVEIIPDLGKAESADIRNRWANIFQSKYINDPTGPMKATLELKNQLAAETKPDISPVDPELKQAREAERKKELKKSIMHGGGKGGGQKMVSLTGEEERARRTLGLSKEVYMEALKATQGVQNG